MKPLSLLPLLLLTSALTLSLGLSACNRADNPVSDQSLLGDSGAEGSAPLSAPRINGKAIDDYITLNATHAFDTPAPIAKIAFTPNDVASWLGVVGMLSTEGHFYTTSIEGDVINLISEDKHTDIIGLDRPGAPGMFLAVMDDGALRAYVESDDQFGFKSIEVGSVDEPYITICDTGSAITTSIVLVGSERELAVFAVNATNETVTLEQVQLDDAPTLMFPKACALGTTGGVTTFGASKSNDLYLNNLSTKQSVKISGFAPSPDTEITMIDTGDASSIAVNTPEAAFSLYDTQNYEVSSQYKIERGLSIAGLSLARTIASTSSPFGGSGFNDGVVALADAEENRVVILSRSYLLDNIPD